MKHRRILFVYCNFHKRSFCRRYYCFCCCLCFYFCCCYRLYSHYCCYSFDFSNFYRFLGSLEALFWHPLIEGLNLDATIRRHRRHRQRSRLIRRRHPGQKITTTIDAGGRFRSEDFEREKQKTNARWKMETEKKRITTKEKKKN